MIKKALFGIAFIATLEAKMGVGLNVQGIRLGTNGQFFGIDEDQTSQLFPFNLNANKTGNELLIGVVGLQHHDIGKSYLSICSVNALLGMQTIKIDKLIPKDLDGDEGSLEENIVVCRNIKLGGTIGLGFSKYKNGIPYVSFSLSISRYNVSIERQEDDDPEIDSVAKNTVWIPSITPAIGFKFPVEKNIDIDLSLGYEFGIKKTVFENYLHEEEKALGMKASYTMQPKGFVFNSSLIWNF
jgi:hypothetical protein